MSTSSEFTQVEPGEPELGSREDWDIIEAALGFKGFDPRRRKALCRRLQITVKLYYPRLGKRQHELRPAHFKSALGVLRNHATRLRTYLDAQSPELWPTDELAELEDLAMGVFLCEHYSMVSNRKQNALINRLTELIDIVDNALQLLPEDKGGRPRDDRLRAIIYHLADLYREHTGKAPGISWDEYKQQYRGPFLRLVKGVLMIFVPDHVKDDTALAGDIRRVLKWWRQSRLGMNKTSN